VGAFDDTGMLTIYAGTSGEQIGDLVDLTLQELRRSADDMSAAELDRARAQMKAGLLMGLESPSARAERNARLVAIWDRMPPLEETVARIDAVNLRPCGPMPRALTASGRSAMALYGPVAGAPGHDPDQGASGRLMLSRKRHLRIETDRLTLRLPRHADFRAWAALRAASRAVPDPVGTRMGRRSPQPQGLHEPCLLGAAAISQGSAVPLFIHQRG
jgi:hypothetical protein